MDDIVFGAFRTDLVHLCRGRVDLVRRASESHLPVSGAYANPQEARAAIARMSVSHTVVAIRSSLPAGAHFEVLEGSPGDRRGRRSVAVMSSFAEALKVADGRGFMGIGQCRIDLVNGPQIFATAEEFVEAGRARRDIALLSWQGLNARFFTIDQPPEPIALAAVVQLPSPAGVAA